METLNGLKPDMEVYFRYKKRFVEEITGEKTLDLRLDNVISSTYAKSILLPSQHVELVSEFVDDEYNKLRKKKCSGANINSRVDALFEKHWIKMCEAEGDDELYNVEMNSFTKFIREMNEAVELVNALVVEELPFLSE